MGDTVVLSSVRVEEPRVTSEGDVVDYRITVNGVEFVFEYPTDTAQYAAALSEAAKIYYSRLTEEGLV